MRQFAAAALARLKLAIDLRAAVLDRLTFAVRFIRARGIFRSRRDGR